MILRVCFLPRFNTTEKSAPITEGPSPTGGSSFDTDMGDLTSRLGSMSVLLQGSSQDDETTKLLEAMAAISIDSDTRQQRRPPAIGLRGPGAAFQVMGASVARDASNIFRIGSKNDDGSPKRKGTRFSSRLRDLKCKARAGRAVAETGDSARKRQNKNKSPVWRVERRDRNARFMEKHRYGNVFDAARWGGAMDGGAGESRTDRDDLGDGGDGEGPMTDDGGNDEAATRGGSATNATGTEHDEIPCTIWDDCMGGEETGPGAQRERGRRATADQTALNANIVGKNNSVEGDQRKFLILLYHLHTCRADGGGEMCEVTKHCPALRRTWRHMKTCDATGCPIAVRRSVPDEGNRGFIGLILLSHDLPCVFSNPVLDMHLVRLCNSMVSCCAQAAVTFRILDSHSTGSHLYQLKQPRASPLPLRQGLQAMRLREVRGLRRPTRW